MQKAKSLNSLTIFFPFFNDEGTVEDAITQAYTIGEELTGKLEVIAIHGGSSNDRTMEEIKRMKKKFKDLVIIDRTTNDEGYGVIKYGFLHGKGEWIFYTDGDLQYNLLDLMRLAKKQKDSGADVINGFKIVRGDTSSRTTLGDIYKWITKKLFHLPISDPTCDFRLIRKRIIDKCPLFSKNASICIELIKELEYNGATFAEIPVRHRKRRYGKSNYQAVRLLLERAVGDMVLRSRLRKLYNKML